MLGPQSLAAAAALKQREGGTLGEALVRLGLIDEGRLVAVFQQSLLIPLITAEALKGVLAEIIRVVPAELAAQHRVVPVDIDQEGNLTLAMSDPTDNHAVDEVAARTGRFVLRAVAAPSAVRDALFAHYGVTLIKTPAPPEKPISGAPGHTAPPSPDTVPVHVQPEAGGAEKEARRPPDFASAQSREVPPALPGQEPPRAARSGPGSALSALARAMTGERPVVPAEADAPVAAGGNGAGGLPPGVRAASITPLRPEAEGGRRVRASRPRPSRLAGAVPARVPGSSPSNPILLDRPLRGAPAPSTTLPGLGTPAEELLAPVARLRAAETRDEVIAILLDYASLLAARVGLFVVQKGQLTCLDGRGPDHVVVAMKWFTIPVDEPSPFRDVLQSRAPYIGTLGDSPESRSFRSALGTTSGDLLLLPLIVGDRSVGVLYADEIRTDLGKLSVELEVLSREAGAAFSRIIVSRKSGQRR